MKYVLVCLLTAVFCCSLIVNVALYLRYSDLESDNNSCKSLLGQAYFAALYNDAGVDRCLGLMKDSAEVIDRYQARLAKCQGIR